MARQVNGKSSVRAKELRRKILRHFFSHLTQKLVFFFSLDKQVKPFASLVLFLSGTSGASLASRQVSPEPASAWGRRRRRRKVRIDGRSHAKHVQVGEPPLQATAPEREPHWPARCQPMPAIQRQVVVQLGTVQRALGTARNFAWLGG